MNKIYKILLLVLVALTIVVIGVLGIFFCVIFITPKLPPKTYWVLILNCANMAISFLWGFTVSTGALVYYEKFID